MAGPFFGHFLCLEVGSYSSVFRLEVFNKKAFSIFDLASEALAPVRERQRGNGSFISPRGRRLNDACLERHKHAKGK